MRHFMIDLETLSTANTAAFMQIGAVEFDLEKGPVGQGLKVQVDPQLCINGGFRVDWSTLRWWMDQRKEAKDAMPRDGEGVHVRDALGRLNEFFPRGRKFAVWSNGAAFNIPIPESAYRRCRLEVPWMFYNVYDVRTMKLVAPDVTRASPDLAHDALSDAVAQAQ